MNNFLSAWEALFGVYSPIPITDATGAVSYMTDWGYVMRVVFLIVVVFCILRILGGVLKSDQR